MNPFITAAKAKHDVLSVVYKGMLGNPETTTYQLLALVSGMAAISDVITTMEEEDKRQRPD